MAISRLFQSGAEVDAGGSAAYEWPTDSNAEEISSDVVSGTYSYKLQYRYSKLVRTIPSTNQIRFGFHFKILTVGAGSSQFLWRIQAVGVANQASVRLVPSDQRLQFRVNDAFLSTPLIPFRANQWYHMGVDMKVDAVAGWVKVYLDGEEVLSETGDTGSDAIDTVYVGRNSGSTSDNSIWYMDNFYVDDTTGEGSASVPPDLRFEYITPNGNGNYSQWDGSDGNQVNNFEQVDERPNDGDTTYNEAQAADEIDSYAMTTYTLLTNWTIAAVIPCVIAKKSDVGVASQVALMTREGGTDDEGSAQDLTTSYALVSERFTTEPGGGSWDQAALDAVEIGTWAEGTF